MTAHVPGTPIPAMPFTDHQWRNLPTTERRRLAGVWYQRAQPVPLQRRRLAPHTPAGALIQTQRTRWSLAVLAAHQLGAIDRVALVRDLDVAHRDVAALRLRADTGVTLAEAVRDDPALDRACGRVLELSAMLLTHPDNTTATTGALRLRKAAS